MHLCPVPHRQWSHVLFVLVLAVALGRAFFIVRRVCIDPRLLGAIRFVSTNDDSSHGSDGGGSGGMGGSSGSSDDDERGGGRHHHRRPSDNLNSAGDNDDGESHRTGLTHKQGNITRLDSWPGHGTK